MQRPQDPSSRNQKCVVPKRIPSGLTGLVRSGETGLRGCVKFSWPTASRQMMCALTKRYDLRRITKVEFWHEPDGSSTTLPGHESGPSRRTYHAPFSIECLSRQLWQRPKRSSQGSIYLLDCLSAAGLPPDQPESRCLPDCQVRSQRSFSGCVA